MSRYERLAEYLSNHKGDAWDASFAEIESKIGSALPPSAYKYPAWWANQAGAGHSQTRGWRSVGWRTSKLDLERRRVRFERDRARPGRVPSPVESEQDLLQRASELSGIEDQGLLIREALRALIAREAGARLIRLGGTMPDLRVPPRERPEA